MRHKISGKVVVLSRLKKDLAGIRRQGKKIVFTNGCFDLLHPGHVYCLEKLRALGDCLVVGVNTDKSVSKLKGPGRPVWNEKDRARMLAALEIVDFVILFDEPTPLGLIRSVKPDVLAKGSDYEPGRIVGADVVKAYGGKVITIKLLPGYSTTDMIRRIK